MSGYGGYYSDEAPRRRSRRTRRPVYEEKIVESRQGRGQPPLQQALVRRPRSDSSSSIEEIEREFDPESGAYIQRQRVTRDRYGDQYTNGRTRSDTGRSRKSGRSGGGRRRRDSYDSYDSYDSDSESDRKTDRSRPVPKRKQSVGERALEAVGLGGAAAAIADKVRGRSKSRPRGRDDSRDRDDRRDSYQYDRRTQSAGPGRGRSASRGPDKRKKIEDAAKAALAAAAIEAWRSRKNVGGEAGKRILTAAIGAAGIDAVVQQEDRHGNRNALASAIGGLATNRLVNGRSRSRSRPGQRQGDDKVGAAASVAALAALAGKAIKDHRDRSKSRPRGGDRDSDYYGSDADEDYNRNGRRKSLSERFYKPTDRVLAKMGLGESENHKSCYYVDKYGRRHYSDDEDQDDNRDGPRLRGGGGSSSSSDSCSTDSYSSGEERDKIKKMRNKGLITGGLAAVATIHAAHSVYSSMEARDKRHKKVLEGKMTPEEARRLKSRAALQDVAAVGIAALGIKGAISEWKEVKETRGSMTARNVRLEEKREHREAKKARGEWDEEVWRRKREQRAKSQGRLGGAAAGGAIANEAYNDRRSSSARSNGRRRIGDGRDRDDRDSERDYGRSRGRSRRDDYDDSSSDDDDAYYEYRDRRGNRNSLPPDFSRGKSHRSFEKYDSPEGGRRRAESFADGPFYSDGNPYASTLTQTGRSSGLREQLPPPPVGYSAAPRY